jgi:hypothetical protein
MPKVVQTLWPFSSSTLKAVSQHWEHLRVTKVLHELLRLGAGGLSLFPPGTLENPSGGGGWALLVLASVSRGLQAPPLLGDHLGREEQLPLHGARIHPAQGGGRLGQVLFRGQFPLLADHLNVPVLGLLLQDVPGEV